MRVSILLDRIFHQMICLTHCILNRISHTIYWKSPISILGMSGYEIYRYSYRKKAKLFPNSGDPFCSVLSGSALFANYPFKGSPDYNGLIQVYCIRFC